MKYDVFISYSRKDTAIADQICAAFDKAGISYFIDRQGIVGSGEFPDILAEAILNCQFFLFLASKNSYSSKYTKKEIFFAFNEKPSGTLFPYIIDDSSLPNAIKLVFSDNNIRSIKVHPIETTLVDDVLRLLGRFRAIEKDYEMKQTVTDEIELIPQEKNGKWGFVDFLGNKIIPFEYSKAKRFSEGFAPVMKNGKWGFIDKKGYLVVAYQFDYVFGYYDGFSIVAKNNNNKYKFSYLNNVGEAITPFIFDNANLFSEGFAGVMKDEKWGFINKKGKIEFPIVYDQIDDFSHGYARVKKKNFYGLINTFGKETIPCEFYSIYYDDHYTFLESFPDQYIDRRLRKKFVYEDYILVCKIEEHNGAYKWGYYNKNGNLIIPFKYDNALPFTESLAPVMKNGKWGFIDKKGKVVISFIYQKVANFDGDKAKVTKKNLFGKEQTFYIDQQGNRID